MTLLDRVLGPNPPPFALIHRSERPGVPAVEVVVGEISTPDTLAGIPLDAPARPDAGHDVLAVIPYRQIAERGFACVDDGTPLVAMTITGQELVPMADALARLPDARVDLVDAHFDSGDEAYADRVRRIVGSEICAGEGSNFVIKRSLVADVDGYTTGQALSVFRRLLTRESGAYWTFIVHTGTRTLVGATPERHVSLSDGTAVMNPISGTYRYPATGATLEGIMDFLADRKESEELYMVVDEELKMMSRISDSGVRAVGPYLREMARLAHTEYLIEGRTSRDPREILRETMFAPTVTGSPLESACRVIARHEPGGRGYYGGVLALIGRDAGGSRAMDSAIIIRTADIDESGRLAIGVGATLVRHSDPDSEAAETRAKMAGLLAALGGEERVRFGDHPSVRAALARRNTGIADFWLADERGRARPDPELRGRRVLVVDAEDTFTSMLQLQLSSLGLAVTVRRFDEPYNLTGYDLVVMGPGPGDPREAEHPKIAHLRSTIGALIAGRQPFLCICLSHQVLSARLGFDLVRRTVPNQGVQREIDLFGSCERVGFYNTFVAASETETALCRDVGIVEVSRDAATGEVHALRGPRFASTQFHPESVLTVDGLRIVAGLLREVLGGASRRHERLSAA